MHWGGAIISGGMSHVETCPDHGNINLSFPGIYLYFGTVRWLSFACIFS